MREKNWCGFHNQVNWRHFPVLKEISSHTRSDFKLVNFYSVLRESVAQSLVNIPIKCNCDTWHEGVINSCHVLSNKRDFSNSILVGSHAWLQTYPTRCGWDGIFFHVSTPMCLFITPILVPTLLDKFKNNFETPVWFVR